MITILKKRVDELGFADASSIKVKISQAKDGSDVWKIKQEGKTFKIRKRGQYLAEVFEDFRYSNTNIWLKAFKSRPFQIKTKNMIGFQIVHL